MKRFLYFILIIAMCIFRGKAWVQLHRQQGTQFSSFCLQMSRDDSVNTSFTTMMPRRALLGTVLGGALLGAENFTPVARASDGDDPFAQLDAFAEKIRESSNYPNSISPLPTSKTSEKDLTSDDAELAPQRKTPSEGESDMDKALRELQKQKRIEPRTHG